MQKAWIVLPLLALSVGCNRHRVTDEGIEPTPYSYDYNLQLDDAYANTDATGQPAEGQQADGQQAYAPETGSAPSGTYAAPASSSSGKSKVSSRPASAPAQGYDDYEPPRGAGYAPQNAEWRGEAPAYQQTGYGYGSEYDGYEPNRGYGSDSGYGQPGYGGGYGGQPGYGGGYGGQPAYGHGGDPWSDYRQTLDPYGDWRTVPTYGTVWTPRVSAGWRPYVDGRWVAVESGWMWDSHETWGAIPYHYGHWVLVPSIGWAWVPGREWAPARVVWREGHDCVGWAPLPPPRVSYGTLPPQTWVVVPTRQFLAPRISVAIVAAPRVHTWLPQTRVIRIERQAPIWRGPRFQVVTGWTGRPVKVVQGHTYRQYNVAAPRGHRQGDTRGYDRSNGYDQRHGGYDQRRGGYDQPRNGHDYRKQPEAGRMQGDDRRAPRDMRGVSPQRDAELRTVTAPSQGGDRRHEQRLTTTAPRETGAGRPARMGGPGMGQRPDTREEMAMPGRSGRAQQPGRQGGPLQGNPGERAQQGRPDRQGGPMQGHGAGRAQQPAPQENGRAQQPAPQENGRAQQPGRQGNPGERAQHGRQGNPGERAQQGRQGNPGERAQQGLPQGGPRADGRAQQGRPDRQGGPGGKVNERADEVREHARERMQQRPGGRPQAPGEQRERARERAPGEGRGRDLEVRKTATDSSDEA